MKYFKEIKRLESFQKAEAYLEPKRISTMELFYIPSSSVYQAYHF